jgi:hypothetical protein
MLCIIVRNYTARVPLEGPEIGKLVAESGPERGPGRFIWQPGYEGRQRRAALPVRPKAPSIDAVTAD